MRRMKKRGPNVWGVLYDLNDLLFFLTLYVVYESYYSKYSIAYIKFYLDMPTARSMVWYRSFILL